MKSVQGQRGATLVVSMIMLMVITVLVVYSIRSGNINLRIAGNMQRQGEAMMASQQVIERVIEQIKTVDNIALIPAQNVTITNAGASYTVTTNAMGAAGSCILSVAVPAGELSDTNPDDQPCFEDLGGKEPMIGADGKPLPGAPSGCKNQTWEVRASINETTFGTQLTQVQGIKLRVPAITACP